MMNCHGDVAQTAKLQRLIAEGKTRDEILATFVQDFGSQDVLTRAARPRLQPPGLAVPVPRRGRGARRHRRHRAALVASGARRGSPATPASIPR